MRTAWEILKKVLPWIGWLLLVLEFLVKHPPPLLT